MFPTDHGTTAPMDSTTQACKESNGQDIQIHCKVMAYNVGTLKEAKLSKQSKGKGHFEVDTSKHYA